MSREKVNKVVHAWYEVLYRFDSDIPDSADAFNPKDYMYQGVVSGNEVDTVFDVVDLFNETFYPDTVVLPGVTKPVSQDLTQFKKCLNLPRSIRPLDVISLYSKISGVTQSYVAVDPGWDYPFFFKGMKIRSPRSHNGQDFVVMELPHYNQFPMTAAKFLK